MSVPGRAQAAGLLLSLNPPPWHLRHASGVAEVAGWLAARIAANGIAVDRRLAETAALLHDIDKIVPADDPARALPHGDGSADWLTRHGLPELARAVASHPVTRLGDEERYRRWSAFATREERIVAYADKRCAQHLETMAARFARWERKHPPIEGSTEPADGADPRPTGGRRRPRWDRETFERVRLRADRLEAEVCRAADVRPEDVRRLRWVGAAIRAARAKGSPS